MYQDTTKQTPLWLNLKKEYIDDNLDNLIKYLAKLHFQEQKDSFYEKTVELLNERVNDLITEYGNTKLFGKPDSEEDVFHNIRLLAASILATRHLKSETDNRNVYMTMMLLLIHEKPRFATKLMNKVKECLLNENLTNPGFTWADLIDFKPDVFTSKVADYDVFARQTDPRFFERYGTAVLHPEHGILLTCTNVGDAQRLVFVKGYEALAIEGLTALRTSGKDRLAQSQQNDLSKIYEFVASFCTAQKSIKQEKLIHRLKQYSDGEEARVTVTRIDFPSRTIHVRTIDEGYEEISGTIFFQYEYIQFYSKEDFCKMMRPGGAFRAQIESLVDGHFSIQSQLTGYMMKSCDKITENLEQAVLARMYKYDSKNNVTIWITENGIPVYVKGADDYDFNDFAWIHISDYLYSNRYPGIVNICGEIVGDATEEERFDSYKARKSCIDGFMFSAVEHLEYEKADYEGNLNEMTLKLIMRILFVYQRNLLKPIDRFRYLMNALVIATLIDDQANESYLRFSATYLMTLVKFARDESLDGITLTPDPMFEDAESTQKRMLIVDLLKRYGLPEATKDLDEIINRYSDTPAIANVARLIQAANTLSDTLKSGALNIIRREIIHTLNVETERNTDIEDENSEYLGIESGTQEFKTSIVFPPENNGQPDEARQNVNVMRAVCAFLNSETGGTLYLGVNDRGYVSGIQGDMEQLRLLYIDEYARYIQDCANRLLGKDATMCLQIEPMFNNRCMAVHVKSHPYRVVELDHKAYLRINAESREMTQSIREYVIGLKSEKDKDRDKKNNLAKLYQAQAEHRVVILHRYTSLNSGDIANREAEIYDVREDENLAIGYDLDQRDIRVYNFNRIGYVEVTDRPWTNESHHIAKRVDDFHMSSDTTFHVTMSLDLFSKELLIEEFPSSKEHLSQDKNSRRWIYSADVCSVHGIGRFYIGLANHIDILHAPELVEHIHDFRDTYLK